MQDLAVIQRARRLRKSATLLEVVLWRHLRDKQIGGIRFRRQVPIGTFVVDFACLSIRLIVEVDGGVHDLRAFDDAKRDAWLRSQRFSVIRFTNGDVMNRLNAVLAEICNHAPSPISGEGVRRSLTDGAARPGTTLTNQTDDTAPIRLAPRATFPRNGGRSDWDNAAIKLHFGLCFFESRPILTTPVQSAK